MKGWVVLDSSLVLHPSSFILFLSVPVPNHHSRPGQVMTLDDLPTLNASLNATCAVLLVSGFVMIKQKRVTAHKACMLSAGVLSVIFLTSYLNLTMHMHSL